LQERGYPDDSHSDYPLASTSVMTRPGDIGLWRMRTPTAL
jgi:hypothetical protein